MKDYKDTRKVKEDIPVVAICYDFDKTLSPDNMQEQGYIQAVGYEKSSEFWDESNALAENNDMDQNLSYMYMMLKIKGVDFAERMNAVVELYNSRRKDKAFANEVLDDVAEQLTKLLEELGKDKQSFEALNISFEEKAFFDILEALAKKYGFYDQYIKEYGEEHLLSLAKDIKAIVDDKAKYAAWSAREDIKAEPKVNIILKLAEYKYPPVTQDEVYKEVLEQAENFRKYSV